MTDEATPDVTPDTVETQAPEQAPEAQVDGAFDFVLDKYKAEGRTEQESAYEQAKAYTELQKQFGSFSGAPDDYEINIDETAKELGIDIDPDNPLFSELQEMGKEMQLNNDGMNKMLNIVAKNALAEMNAAEDARNAEIAQLTNSGERIEQINKFLSSNLSAEHMESIQSMPQTAAQVEGLEQLIQMVKGTSTQPVDTAPPNIDHEALSKLQFAKDEYGNRKMSTDPAYRKMVEAKIKEAHGVQEHRKMMG